MKNSLGYLATAAALIFVTAPPAAAQTVALRCASGDGSDVQQIVLDLTANTLATQGKAYSAVVTDADVTWYWVNRLSDGSPRLRRTRLDRYTLIKQTTDWVIENDAANRWMSLPSSTPVEREFFASTLTQWALEHPSDTVRPQYECQRVDRAL